MNAQLSRRTVLNAIYNQKLTDPIVITSLPTTVDLVGELGERAFIYYCVDEFTHYPGLPNRIIAEMEKELLSKADLVIVTSSELQKRKQGNKKEARLIPHGVDVDHFAQYKYIGERSQSVEISGIARRRANEYPRPVFCQLCRSHE